MSQFHGCSRHLQWFLDRTGQWRENDKLFVALLETWPQPLDAVCCSVAQSCLTLQPHGLQHFPVHHLPGFAQVHVHWVGDAIQPSLPLSSPSAFNLSQRQGLFQWAAFALLFYLLVEQAVLFVSGLAVSGCCFPLSFTHCWIFSNPSSLGGFPGGSDGKEFARNVGSSGSVTGLGRSPGAATAKSLQSCPTVRPHGLQPTRLLHPWDFPGNSTGVGCHCLLGSPGEGNANPLQYSSLGNSKDRGAWQASPWAGSWTGLSDQHLLYLHFPLPLEENYSFKQPLE